MDGKYSIEQLANYIALTTHLTGVAPKKVEVSPDFYTWYVQTVNKTVESLGGQLVGDGVMKYQNVILEKKGEQVIT